MGGKHYFWLGASAEPTGLGSADAPEPVKPSPSFGCHPSRAFTVDGIPCEIAVAEPTAMFVQVLAHGIYDGTRLLCLPRSDPHWMTRFYEGDETVEITGGEEFETCPRGTFAPPRRHRA